MEIMLQPLRKYAQFAGRSTRTEYWMFVLFKLLVLVAWGFVSFVLGLVAVLDPSGLMATAVGMLTGAVFLIGVLGLIVPTAALVVRRLHDVGVTGWLALLVFVPLGGLVIFIISLLDGTEGPNRHGPDPRRRGDGRPMELSETFS